MRERAQIAALRARQKFARQSLDRARSLVASGSVPDAELDAEESNYASISAEIASLRAQVERKLIRVIGDPNLRFREDPVRMLRACELAGRLGFSIEDEAQRAIRRWRADILKASPARLVEELVHRLEIHYLASPDPQLHFALLTDWMDSATERAPDDDALLDVAIVGVARLNRRYGLAAGGERFLLLHRRRVWCESEQRWMGWERKRGKLDELNRLLRGATDTTYVTSTGRTPWVPQGIRYVLTLDADTRVPRDAPRRLIGKMAHPLNRARFDLKTGRVVEGYAILQPRVAFSLPVKVEATPFQRVFSGASGVDPYAAAVSDVYQDLLGEGSFAGKGIYDVDAFEASLAGRVPESSLLSHDLFEGIFARAGLASDVEVVEEFPARYDVASLRQHRWVRGDWQLLPWILGRRMPALGRWKMLDNLRRSLLPPAMLAALVAGWTLPLPVAAGWTAFILLTILLPGLLPVLGAVLPRKRQGRLRSYFRGIAEDVAVAVSRTFLTTVLLAHQAWLMADAIVRTLWRLLRRRYLLEWVTAAQIDLGPWQGLRGSYRQMAGALALTAGAAAGAVAAGGDTALLAAPFLVLWACSPAIALRASQPPAEERSHALSDAESQALRRIAPDVARRDVYLCGPGGWMTTVRSALEAVGVPDNQIHCEDFAW